MHLGPPTWLGQLESLLKSLDDNYVKKALAKALSAEPSPLFDMRRLRNAPIGVPILLGFVGMWLLGYLARC